jgi:hypothetical protein
MTYRHKWTLEEMEEQIDICLAHPPGIARALAGQRLAQKINANPNNQIEPKAIGQALKAAEKALVGNYEGKPKPSRALIRLVEARRGRSG